MNAKPHRSPASLSAAVADAAALLGPGARSEVELLLCHAIDRPRVWLFAHAGDVLDEAVLQRFHSFVARRRRGEPIAQIIGQRGFWSLDLQVTADVLIPRAETELLVECALAALPQKVPLQIADLGTGSGAVALAIASERPFIEVVAVDASAAALEVARFNVQTLGFSARVDCLLGDWFGPLGNRRFHAIVSNPPYIAQHDPHLDEGDLRFEPREALASGHDGLDAIRLIARGAPAHLRPDGWLLLEHGWNQGAAVRALFQQAGFADIATHRDLEARERVTCGRLPEVGTAPLSS